MVAVEKNEPANIQNANEPARDPLKLLKSKSTVLNPSVQRASFCPTAAALIYIL